MKVAVVGASGFVGAAVVQRLQTAGYEVVPFTRGSGNAWALVSQGHRVRMLDVTRRGEADRALAGCDAIVNCTRGGDRVMLAGLRNLLNAARKHSVSRFVHLSSVAVYGDPPGADAETEEGSAAPAPGSYGSVKLQQDGRVERAAARGLSATILCPPNIGGPGSYFFAAIEQALRARRLLLIDDGSQPCNLVDVTNLAYAVQLALEAADVPAERMFVTDGQVPSWRDVIETFCTLLELPQPDTVPRAVFEARYGRAAPPHPRGSIMRALLHPVSSDVREALRADPVWARIDGAVRRSVDLLPEGIVKRLQVSLGDRPAIRRLQVGATPDVALVRQQLRGVVHRVDKIRRTLGYEPQVSSAASIRAYAAWRETLGGYEGEWQVLAPFV